MSCGEGWAMASVALSTSPARAQDFSTFWRTRRRRCAAGCVGGRRGGAGERRRVVVGGEEEEESSPQTAKLGNHRLYE